MQLERWFGLMTELGFPQNQPVFDQLLEAYSERHRRYHNESHIDTVLSTFDTTREFASEPGHVELALWFHDAVYKIFSSSNEEDSAVWARDFVLSQSDSSLCDNQLLARDVYSLIMSTRHNTMPERHDEKLIVDIDLAILGAPKSEYDKFEQSIRKEYKLIPWPVYRKKRIEILQGFLQRSHIYSLGHFRDGLEVTARSNLSDAIDNLQGSSRKN